MRSTSSLTLNENILGLVGIVNEIEQRYKGIKSAERLLVLIETLNHLKGAKVSELADATGFSRPAVYRLLNALDTFGYVRQQKSDDRFYLTHLVRRLSDGFSEEDWVQSIAAPVLQEAVEEIMWPVDLITFLNDAMYIRETTRAYSPFTIDWVSVGERLPMLVTSVGRAYLSFCPKPERLEILESLRRSDDEFDKLVHDQNYVQKIIKDTQKRGYGVRDDGFHWKRKTSSIAVPIMNGPRVTATLAITFISSAVTAEEIAKRHLEALRSAAHKIEIKVKDAKTTESVG
jgi:IclR family transcriptional regulator, mhp operon transcriptional activator